MLFCGICAAFCCFHEPACKMVLLFPVFFLHVCTLITTGGGASNSDSCQVVFIVV